MVNDPFVHSWSTWVIHCECRNLNSGYPLEFHMDGMRMIFQMLIPQACCEIDSEIITELAIPDVYVVRHVGQILNFFVATGYYLMLDFLNALHAHRDMGR